MRILFSSASFGNVTFIRNQVDQIARLHNVHYVCNINHSSVDDPFLVSEIPFKYPVLLKKIRDRLEMQKIFLTFINPSFRKVLKRKVDEFNPDVIHLQFGYEALKFIDNYNENTILILIQFRGYDASQKLKNDTYLRRLRKVLSQSNVYTRFSLRNTYSKT